jgi:hypothetical protein
VKNARQVGVCDKEESATAILTALVLLLTIQRSLRKVWRHYNVIRSRKSKDRQHNGQKDKQRSTKHYTEN